MQLKLVRGSFCARCNTNPLMILREAGPNCLEGVTHGFLVGKFHVDFVDFSPVSDWL